MVNVVVDTHDGQHLFLSYTGKHTKNGGQHGSHAIFIDENSGKKWLFKTFESIIHPESRFIDVSDLDLDLPPSYVSGRSQFVRVASE